MTFSTSIGFTLPMHWSRFLIFTLLLCVLLTACAVEQQPLAPVNSASSCPVTTPVWAKPPEDTAVSGSPEYGYYFVNEDRSIWASAWWVEQNAIFLLAGEEGIKMGWFRPAGADLLITGQRLDGKSPPLEAHAPCCYPTRFQASGLVFPTAGCWEINAKTGNSEIAFVVEVETDQ